VTDDPSPRKEPLLPRLVVAAILLPLAAWLLSAPAHGNPPADEWQGRALAIFVAVTVAVFLVWGGRWLARWAERHAGWWALCAGVYGAIWGWLMVRPDLADPAGHAVLAGLVGLLWGLSGCVGVHRRMRRGTGGDAGGAP
jgi:hypothetical protein